VNTVTLSPSTKYSAIKVAACLEPFKLVSVILDESVFTGKNVARAHKLVF
jgi:hypothetical protein